MYKEFFGITEQSSTPPIHTAISAYTNMKLYPDQTKKAEIRKKAERIAQITSGLMFVNQPKNPDLLFFKLSGNKDKAIQEIESLRVKYPDLTKLQINYSTPVKTDKDGVSIEEARLTNKITDYKGGVLYQLSDPSTYENVRSDIERFANEKGLRVIQNKFDSTKGTGYMRFTQSEDIGKDSQRIQGFISQLPEVLKFKFKVLKRNNNN